MVKKLKWLSENYLKMLKMLKDLKSLQKAIAKLQKKLKACQRGPTAREIGYQVPDYKFMLLCLLYVKFIDFQH